MALIDPAPIDIRIKELHGKKILITMCLFNSGWRHALRFATDVEREMSSEDCFHKTDSLLRLLFPDWCQVSGVT